MYRKKGVNKMKKLISLLMILVILTMTLVGCGTTGKSSDGTNEEKPYHIGVILYGKEDSLGSIVYSNINHAADVLGVKVTWALGDLDPTSQIASAENLITSGVDGILCLPLSAIATQKISALCEENEVYFGITFRTIDDEDIKQEVEQRKYYIGNTTGADEENAMELVRIMVEKGKKNTAFYYATPGSSNALRNDGFRKASQE